MKITEGELRSIIRSVILEEYAINEVGVMKKLADKSRSALGIGAMAAAAKFGGLGGMSNVHAQKPSYEQQLELPKIVKLYKDAFPDLPWQKIESSKDRQTLERLIFGDKSSGQNNTFYKAMYDHAIERGKSEQFAKSNAHEAGLELQHALQDYLVL